MHKTRRGRLSPMEARRTLSGDLTVEELKATAMREGITVPDATPVARLDPSIPEGARPDLREIETRVLRKVTGREPGTGMGGGGVLPYWETH